MFWEYLFVGLLSILFYDLVQGLIYWMSYAEHPGVFSLPARVFNQKQEIHRLEARTGRLSEEIRERDLEIGQLQFKLADAYKDMFEKEQQDKQELLSVLRG